jgi:hypothetical protein
MSGSSVLTVEISHSTVLHEEGFTSILGGLRVLRIGNERSLRKFSPSQA